MTDTIDPGLDKRHQVKKLVRLAKLVGYGSFLLATILLLINQFGSSTAGVESTILILLIIGSIALAPAIVFGYAAKAADRADREQSW